jgi:hypothetical protein
MNQWTVTDPWIFFSVGGAIVAYLLYMIIRRRRGERAGFAENETEL